MLIRYKNAEGLPVELTLSDKPLTIGRSPDADVVVLDERASRIHCGLRLWDNEYYIKDLKSKNGTFLNNERVEMAKIKPGDKVRVGTFVITVVDETAPKVLPGTNTSLNEIEAAMDEGKGFNTIMREIVADTGPKVPKGKISFDATTPASPPSEAARSTVEAIQLDDSSVLEEGTENNSGNDSSETHIKQVKVKKLIRPTIKIKRP